MTVAGPEEDEMADRSMFISPFLQIGGPFVGVLVIGALLVWDPCWGLLFLATPMWVW